ncbi:hypothetical protein [Saccharothrix yanglingensis]|uniref:Uncharacterized protein n=1 Tax=Saccharothrix yanglingensis TaxID=659496 RepID=A0ABU0X276_9PSEU|nr:hypothetical protein [Saccharothrix yanglingensis]MDQ2586228.1 hypothetical protein [Saccharothrix yanglingensis]
MQNGYQTVVDVEATDAEAADLAAAVTAWLVERGVVVAGVTSCAGGPGHAPGPERALAAPPPDADQAVPAWNGLQVVVGRAVHYTRGDQGVLCPHCGADVGLERVADSFDEWLRGEPGARPCPACARELDPNGWRWVPQWGFGAVAFTFWNWPPLRPGFVAELSARLGHRTVVVADEL